MDLFPYTNKNYIELKMYINTFSLKKKKFPIALKYTLSHILYFNLNYVGLINKNIIVVFINIIKKKQ